MVKYSLEVILDLGVALSTWLFYLILYFTAVDFMLADQQSSAKKVGVYNSLDYQNTPSERGYVRVTEHVSSLVDLRCVSKFF